MTCVVGVRGKSGVLLAGDSMLSSTWGNRKMQNSKVHALSEVVAMAYCGSARLGNILSFHTEDLYDPPLGRDEHRWAVKTFIPYLRGLAEEHGHLHIHHNVEHLGQSAFLLAVRGRLFTVDGDLQVAEHGLPYDALGSGEDVAIGSLHSQLGDDPNPVADERLEEVASAAIEAATEFTNHVGGRITSVQTVIYSEAERELARQIVKRRR